MPGNETATNSLALLWFYALCTLLQPPVFFSRLRCKNPSESSGLKGLEGIPLIEMIHIK